MRWLEGAVVLPWLLLLVSLLLLVALLGWWRSATRLGRWSRRRQRRAQRGEARAEALLAARGFTVLEEQAEQRWQLWVGDRARPVVSRADLLVERDGRLYVADVKTGRDAPDPALPATRRQLLEYLLAFQADGALVVDMEAGEVHVLDYGELSPELTPPPP